MKMFSRLAMPLALACALGSAVCGAPPPEQSTKDSISFRLRLKPAADARTGKEHAVDAAALAQTQAILSKRLTSAGIAKAEFTPQPPDRLIVRCEGLTPVQVTAVRKAVIYLAVLDFCTVHGDNDTLLPDIESKKAALDPAWIILPMKETRMGEEKPRKLIVKRVPEITGDEIKLAYVTYDTYGWNLSIQFTKEVGDKFFDITRKMRVSIDRFAIVLDGIILSAPTTQVAGGIAGGSCVITGKFTEQEARDLAAALMNPLRHPVVIEEESVK